MGSSMSNAPVSRLVLLAAAISGIFLLLATTSAQSETIDGAVTPLASATEDAVSTEEAPVPALPVEAPAETPEPESAVEVVDAVVETASTAIKSNPASSTASAASETVREATSETARRAATGAVGEVATKTATAVGDQTQQLSGLSEEIGTKVSAVAGHGDPSRLAKLVQPAGTSSSGMLSSPGESPVSESPVSVATAPHTYGAVQPVGALPRVDIGGVSSLPAKYRGFSGAESSWPRALQDLDGIQSTLMSSKTNARSNDPVPLDGPTPAPGSSAAAAGSAGSFFVPLAALLALLALVAPATLRRLGEVPAFRPPVPFVCALERPG